MLTRKRIANRAVDDTEVYCDIDVSIVRMLSRPRRSHLLLFVPPGIRAAFFWRPGNNVNHTTLASLLVVFMLTACAGGPPELPYPAFVQVDDLSDVFMASLPGVRAKQMAGDSQTRRTSNRIDLPAGWSGTSGGSPGRSLEIFVLDGRLRIADLDLGPGGYAFLPSGSLGFNLHAAAGARILYFRNDVDPESVIRSPIIIDVGLLVWEGAVSPGVFVKELRHDPGNGARTWLLKVSTGARMPWLKSSTVREGYLVEGDYRHSECVNGEEYSDSYLPGGYFYRPADTVNGGPQSVAARDAVWLLREAEGGSEEVVQGCTLP